MTMLQITFLFIGFFILILVLATIFKRYQRTILWTAAICMFLGVLFSVGFGYVDVIDGDVPNLPVITFIEIFDKVIIYKFASTYVCSEYSFFQPLQSATFCGLLLSIPLCYSCSSIHFLTLLTAVVCQGDITHIVAHRYWILLEE